MKPWPAVLVVVLLVGCSGLAPTQPGGTATTTAAPATDGQPTSSQSTTRTTTPPGQSSGPTTGGRDDPETDVLGWEGGYWHNESIPVEEADGLNETERDLLTARTMARVEVLRGVEFGHPVPVSLRSRDEYRPSNLTGSEADALQRLFRDVRYEALFVVGSAEDGSRASIEDQVESIRGYYNTRQDVIVIVVDQRQADAGVARIDGDLLAHELAHAIQARHYWNSMGLRPSTTDGRTAYWSVWEGEAQLIGDRYRDRCGSTWDCVQYGDDSTSGGTTARPGFVLERAFRYVAGRGFVTVVTGQAGLGKLTDVYPSMPASTEQIIFPETYPDDEPARIGLPDVRNDSWQRVQPGQYRQTDSLGAAGIAIMFATTARDGRPGNALPGNGDEKTTARVSAETYRLAYAEGWNGDRFAVYRDDANRTGYVWRIGWDTETDADEFATGYRSLLEYYGAEQRSDGVWRFTDSSRFDGTVTLRTDATHVTIIHEPEQGALNVA